MRGCGGGRRGPVGGAGQDGQAVLHSPAEEDLRRCFLVCSRNLQNLLGVVACGLWFVAVG